MRKNDRLDITEYTGRHGNCQHRHDACSGRDKRREAGCGCRTELGRIPCTCRRGRDERRGCDPYRKTEGILMQEAVPVGIGAMAAILALDASKIEEVLSDIDDVSIANYNCPGQIVISGRKEAVEEANAKLLEAGAKRAVMLNVSGPFHSAMLAEAGRKLGEVLAGVTIHTPVIPYVANVTAQYVTKAEDVRPLLRNRCLPPSDGNRAWKPCFAGWSGHIYRNRAGKTLAGFMRKDNKRCKSH